MDERQLKILNAIVKPRRSITHRAIELVSDLDGYSAILRAHSLIEASLFDAIMVKAQDRPWFEKVKISFMATVHLAIAFKVLDDDWHKFMATLDTVRGELAHSFEDITENKLGSIVKNRPQWVAATDKELNVPTNLSKFRVACIFAVTTAQEHERNHELDRMIAYLKEQEKEPPQFPQG